MEQIGNFTEGKILPQLLSFALPVLLAQFLQAMYGAVDLLVVGQFASAQEVSAVSTGSQIMMTVTMVITGISMGITVLVGQKIGEGRPQEAGKIIGSGITMFAVIAAAATVILVPGAGSVARLMRAPKEALVRTTAYIRICSSGLAFIVAYNILGSIFRGIGDSKMPLMTVAIACAVNIGGDLLFVAGFGIGAAGAALATVLAQAVSVLLSFLIIRRRKLPFTFSGKNLRFDMALIRKILSLGLPVALQDFLVSISFLAILAIVNSMGVIASAGLGVAEKLCAFVMLVPSSYMQSMSAFVAQNFGAGKYKRADEALLCGILTSLAAGAVLFYVSFFHGDILTSIFTGDPAIIAAGADYLRAYAIDCILTSFLFCLMGYFNGCGMTFLVMVQGIFGAFCVRLPVAYLMSRAANVSLFRIGLATPCSSAVQILICLSSLFFMRTKRAGAKTARDV